jgi:hypothetical protein
MAFSGCTISQRKGANLVILTWNLPSHGPLFSTAKGAFAGGNGNQWGHGSNDRSASTLLSSHNKPPLGGRSVAQSRAKVSPEGVLPVRHCGTIVTMTKVSTSLQGIEGAQAGWSAFRRLGNGIKTRLGQAYRLRSSCLCLPFTFLFSLLPSIYSRKGKRHCCHPLLLGRLHCCSPSLLPSLTLVLWRRRSIKVVVKREKKPPSFCPRLPLPSLHCQREAVFPFEQRR